MSEPNVRSNIGAALEGQREKWYIQGHIGSTWQNGQYVRTRDLPQVKAAFEDLLARMRTDYIDLGMIHYVDEKAEFKRVMQGAFIEYVRGLKAAGTIRHIGLSTHNPDVARLAAEHGEIEMILFSVNPAFDMVPATENLDDYFAETYDEALGGIVPERAALYRVCEQNGVGITVMKGYAGGRLFTAAQSPFGAALTPVTDYLPTCLLLGTVLSLIAASFIPNKPEITNGLICMTFFLAGLAAECGRHGTALAKDVLKAIDYETLALLAGLFS